MVQKYKIIFILDVTFKRKLSTFIVVCVMLKPYASCYFLRPCVVLPKNCFCFLSFLISLPPKFNLN